MAEVMASAKVLLIATAVAALLTADVRAQISDPIPPAGATATISGRVSDVRTEAAVPAATLTLFDEQQRREIGTTADAEGHFRFENIHRGDYALLASHADYVEQLLLVDVRGTLRPARIVVAGGEHIQGIEIKLTRAAHILGRITDEDGHPIEYASVRAIVVRPTQLEGLRSVDANTTTDANGIID